MRRLRSFLDRHAFAAATVLILAVTVPGFVRVQQISGEQDRLLECVTEWSTEQTVRSSALDTASSERTEALDRLIRVVAAPDPSREHFRAALDQYVAASDAYLTVLAEHPVPESPALRCNN
jgi:hypothetical protein